VPLAALALMVAVWSVATTAALIAKLAEVSPTPMVTFAGTVRLALFLDRVTTKPAAAAGWVIVTVQVVAPGVAIVAAMQVSPLS
jgi:hypothetical protein